MRIISGKHKGVRLKGPNKSKTKPITNSSKERLFGIIGDSINDKLVLDLFAGTGSIGIEALSRGAKRVTFVEKNYSALNVIKENLCRCNELEKSKLYNDNALKYLKRSTSCFDFIFSAPPYCRTYYISFLTELDKNADILDKKGQIIIECNVHSKENIELENFRKYKEFKCDDTVFEFWVRKN